MSNKKVWLIIAQHLVTASEVALEKSEREQRHRLPEFELATW